MFSPRGSGGEGTGLVEEATEAGAAVMRQVRGEGGHCGLWGYLNELDFSLALR